MERCRICGQEMGTTSCTVAEIICKGKTYERIKVGFPKDTYFGMKPEGRCESCGSAYGTYHHWGCDQERCPSCGWKVRSCFCNAYGIIEDDPSKQTQEEIRKKYPWVELDAALWEISLVTEELIFCGYIGDEEVEEPVLAYQKETKTLCDGKNDAWVTFYNTLLDAIVRKVELEYISDYTAAYLGQIKQDLLDAIKK